MKTIFSAVMVIVALIASIATTSTVFATTDFESLESHCVVKEQEAHLTYEVLEPTNVKIVVTTNDVVKNTFYFTNAGEQRVEIRAEWSDIVKFFVYLDGNSPAIIQTVDMNQCFGSTPGTGTPTATVEATSTPIPPTPTPTATIIPPFVNVNGFCTDRNTAIIEFTANYDTGNFVRVYEADTIVQYEDGLFSSYRENIFDGPFRKAYTVNKHFTIFELQEERSEMIDPIIVDMFECEPVATATPASTITLQPLPTNTPVATPTMTPTAEPTIPSEFFKDVVGYCDGDNAILGYFAFYDYGNVTEVYFDGTFNSRDVNSLEGSYRLTIAAPNVSTVTFALFDERFIGNIITTVVDMTECDTPPTTPTVLPPTTPNTVYVPDVRH